MCEQSTINLTLLTYSCVKKLVEYQNHYYKVFLITYFSNIYDIILVYANVFFIYIVQSCWHGSTFLLFWCLRIQHPYFFFQLSSSWELTKLT
jgi:hypothetical protein